MGKLDGKVALVTGSGRNIGRATVLKLAGEGADVVVNARSNHEEAEAVAEEARALGVKALPILADVASKEQVDSMVSMAMAEFGKIDILINNAAIGSYTPFLEMTVKEWDLVMSIDLRAPFIACKAVAPIMIEQGGGSIINISSHAATNIFSSTLSADSEEIALIGQNYGAAKVGLERLTWGLALELGPHNIAVNVLKPLRPVITEGFMAQRPDADVSTWATPADMVKAAKYLAGQDAKGLTGATVTAEELVRRLGL